MGRIEAPFGAIMGVGGDIAAVGPRIGELSAAGRAVGSAAAQPAQTSVALAGLGTAWSTSAQRLEEELLALGRAAQSSAVAYRTTDESQMNAGGP